MSDVLSNLRKKCVGWGLTWADGFELLVHKCLWDSRPLFIEENRRLVYLVQKSFFDDHWLVKRKSGTRRPQQTFTKYMTGESKMITTYNHKFGFTFGLFWFMIKELCIFTQSGTWKYASVWNLFIVSLNQLMIFSAGCWAWRRWEKSW